MLWVVFDHYKYGWQHHRWEYLNTDEREEQLHLATGDIIIDGIPWLADPNTQPPFLK
jgi:hypothetical protein